MGSVDLEITAEKIAIVTINNPPKLNAWTREMRVQLRTHLDHLNSTSRDESRAIVITGAGEAFCAGQDLDQAFDWDDEFAHTWVSEFRVLYDQLRRSPKPVVAAVNGVAAGSGFQYSLCADFRVSHPGARLGQPELKSGQASVTGSWLVAKAIGITQMRALVLTADLVPGDEAHRLGLVDRLVEAHDVLPTAIRIAGEMADLPEEAFAQTKIALCELEDAGLDQAFEIAIEKHAAVYASGAPQRAIGEFISRSSRAHN